ncbi:TlpA family protein disulfide reductase [Acetatifactor muris]|jgi:thiol-disulfide isomerase/thioredoxin|uniref:Thiol-disulfide oxidoreductase ResA n=1 Tax=Acetatifactor muris TaxID=879566 RepID=A0A2K4ZCT4_9FIRM|nr:TlpA disulfide reductase family protein [Acetatifactor muris]MCI8799713.1 TlpA family protein disulfide reductase [Lachnospiraceae bacterium]MCR2046685.1 TlpA family protein disulfide reductase [Acetatifactor muris]SOY28276.1 Thiol-disulfide oxidoreductase ResA [Acetatifactor muris]
MKADFKAYLVTGILTIVLLGGCAGQTSEKESVPSAGSPETIASGESELASSESVKDMTVFEAQDTEGNTVSSDIFSESRLTMINVWATYCQPCLREMPELGQLAGEYDKSDFQIIGIISNVQEGAEEKQTTKAKSLIEQTGAAYPHLYLNESLFNALLTDVAAVPTTFFLDEEGNILDTVVGAREKEDWKELIDSLLEDLSQ